VPPLQDGATPRVLSTTGQSTNYVSNHNHNHNQHHNDNYKTPNQHHMTQLVKHAPPLSTTKTITASTGHHYCLAITVSLAMNLLGMRIFSSLFPPDQI
jgi:hypothetical protein